MHGWQGSAVQAFHYRNLHGCFTSAQINLPHVCYTDTLLLHGTTALDRAFTWKLYTFCSVQSLYSKMCLSAHKDAHSALHHHPSKKRARGHAGMPEMGLILAALGTGTSLCWAKDSQPDESTHFVWHRETESEPSNLHTVPPQAVRIYHSEWDHWD